MSKIHSPNISAPYNTADDEDFEPNKIRVYMDLTEIALMPKLTKYITANGGKFSPFLDINVTHMVTDKAKTILEHHQSIIKWNLKVWSVEQFASHLMKYMWARGINVTSPTLHRLTAIKRDLSQCLQEEKRQSKPTKAVTPQFAQTRSSGSAESGGISFVPFEGFHVMIEDEENLHCPLFKEYPMQPSKDDPSQQQFKVPRMPYPIFYWESPIGQCPFIPPLAMQHPQSNTANSTTAMQAKEATGAAVNPGIKAGKSPTAITLMEKENLIKMNSLENGLRVRAARNSTVKSVEHSRFSLNLNAANAVVPNVMFEPAMTDTSIMTAKLKRRVGGHLTAATQGIAVTPTGLGGPSLKMCPNISVNVNRGVLQHSTPRPPLATAQHRRSSPNLSKATTTAATAIAAEDRKSRAEQKQHRDRAGGLRARPGFCECCYEKYSDLERHVRGPIHRQFAIQSDNYESIDSFLSSLKRNLRAEYLISAYQASTLSPITKYSAPAPISPNPSTAGTSTIIAAPRNYTGTKKMKQSLASKRLKMLATTTTSSLLDEEETTAGTPGAAGTLLSSPSCKRKRSHKIAI